MAATALLGEQRLHDEEAAAAGQGAARGAQHMQRGLVVRRRVPVGGGECGRVQIASLRAGYLCG